MLAKLHPPPTRPLTLADVQAATRLVELLIASPELCKRLGPLHEVYAAYIPKDIQASDPERAAETLKAALELGISPQKLKRALQMAWTRDLICQVAASTIGYVLSWFSGAQVTMRALRDGQPPGLRRLATSLTIALGIKVAGDYLRTSGMGGGWTRPVAFTPDGKASPPLETSQGRLRATTVYAPFAPAMLASRFLTADPAEATDRAVVLKRALARQDLRSNLNFVSTVGVALMRYFYAAPARDYWWLDAADKSGDKPGFRKAVMAGAIEELTSPRATAAAALKYVAVRPLIPLYEALRIDRAVEALRSRFADRLGAPDPERPTRRELSPEERNNSRMIAIKSLVLLLGAVLLYQMIDVAAGESAHEPWLAPLNDVVLLLPIWGFAVAMQDRDTAGSPAVRAGNDYRAATWHRQLAQRGGFVAPAAVATPLRVVVQPPDAAAAPGAAASPGDRKGRS